MVQKGVTLTTYYGTIANAGSYQDKEFGVTVQWDSDMLGGYDYRAFNSQQSSDVKRWLIDEWKTNRPDVVWVHGWATEIARAAVRVAGGLKIPVMLRAETSLKSVQGPWYRKLLHRQVYRSYFKNFQAFLAIGSLNRELYLHYGVPSQAIFHFPYCVDNQHFVRLSEVVGSGQSIREQFGFTDQHVVFLFSGKLIQKKNPQLLLQAAQLAAAETSVPIGVLLVGDGELRGSLETIVTKQPRIDVRFAGFRNQSELPAFYAGCDAFVLPSHFEPWGLVVNEALCAGRPVLLSNNIGAAPDLLQAGLNGFTFESTNAQQLKSSMVHVANNASWRTRANAASRAIIDKWSFQECYVGLTRALEYLESAAHV